jgi:hypothetical protein
LLLAQAPLGGGKEIEPPLKDMAEGRLYQLLRVLSAELSNKLEYAILIILLLEAYKVKQDELGGPCKHGELVIVSSWVQPHSFFLS